MVLLLLCRQIAALVALLLLFLFDRLMNMPTCILLVVPLDNRFGVAYAAVAGWFLASSSWR